MRVYRARRRVGALLQRVTGAADALVTHERLRNYPAIFVVLSIALLSISTAQRVMAPQVFGPILPDYLAHWTGGVLLLEGRAPELYDVDAQRVVQAEVVGPSSGLSWFVSPPLVAVLYAPLAMLDYTASALVWFLVSVALFGSCLWSLRSVAPRVMSDHPVLVMLVVCASAPTIELIGGGQDSAFVLATWLLALRLIRSPHQVLAGAVLGLALLKPQHVVLVPIVLLAGRRIAALGGFVIIALAQVALTLAAVGPEGTRAWVGAIGGSDFAEQVQAGQAWKMVSVPALLHALVPHTFRASALMLSVSLVVVAAATLLVMRLVRRQGIAPGLRGRTGDTSAGADPAVLLIVALSTTVVFSPHLVVYDAVLFLPVALYLLEHRPSTMVRLSLVAAFSTMWIAPALHLLAQDLPWPLAVLDAPWSALPLLLLWWQSLTLLSRRDLRLADLPRSL